MSKQRGYEASIDGLGESRGMTNVSAVEKMAELMQQMEENSPRVATLQYCLAQLEAKCAALAAENAALKSTCDDRRTFIMNGVQLGYIKVPTVETDPALETIRVAVSPQEPTPATDAFLAEVRAQGVDAAIEHLNKKFAGTGHIGVPVMALEWLAQELRKGAAL